LGQAERGSEPVLVQPVRPSRRPLHHAWQYVDWVFDGDDLVAASRTAYGDSHNFHDANYLTFHRVRHFRTLTMAEAAPWLGTEASKELKTEDLIISHPGLTVGVLDNSAKAFGNRNYTWQEVPKELAGWSFLRTCGGERVLIVVEARRATVLRVATAPSQSGFNMAGWQRADGLSLIYTSARRTKMAVFERHLKEGQQITVPQGTWTGGVVLLRPSPR